MPLFTIKCKSCLEIVEKFIKNSEDPITFECKCGSIDFERVFDFAVKGNTWRGANDNLENNINPEVDRTQKKINNGSDSEFLDICGD